MKFIGFNTMPIQQFILLSSVNKFNLSSDEFHEKRFIYFSESGERTCARGRENETYELLGWLVSDVTKIQAHDL